MSHTRTTRAGLPDFLTTTEWEAILLSMKLSSRERDVVKLVLRGASEVDIGRKLCISGNTVHTYLARLYRKVDVGDRVGLVLRVFEAFVRARDAATTETPDRVTPV
jgi:DNA-binding NarL/FixJ family response regulator